MAPLVTLNVRNQKTMGQPSQKKPYSERSLIERIESNWTKTIGLFRRAEYSTVAIRAATTVELAANLVIMHEFIDNRKLPRDLVEGLMKWANGFKGKLDHLIVPIFKESEYKEVLSEIRRRSKYINNERNNVVHRGQFKQRATAERLIKEAEFIVKGLIKIANLTFSLETPDLEPEDEEA